MEILCRKDESTSQRIISQRISWAYLQRFLHVDWIKKNIWKKRIHFIWKNFVEKYLVKKGHCQKCVFSCEVTLETAHVCASVRPQLALGE